MSAPVFASLFAALFVVSLWWMKVSVKADLDLPDYAAWGTLLVFAGSFVGFVVSVAWAVFQ